MKPLLVLFGCIAGALPAHALQIGDPVAGAPAAPAEITPKHDGMYYSLPVMPKNLTTQMPDLPNVPDTQNPPLPPEGLVEAVEPQASATTANDGPLTDQELQNIYDELVYGDDAPKPQLAPKTTALKPIAKPNAMVSDINDQIKDEDRLYLPAKAPKTLMDKTDDKAPDPAEELKTQTEMGINYLTGKNGVKANPDMAISLLKQAAGQDYAEAQFWLGEAFSGGLGVKANDNRAFSWYAQAAELGYVPAQMKLSTMYMLGKGISFNVKKAYLWLEIAKLAGAEDAAFIQQNLRNQLTMQDLNDLEKDARAFKPRKPLAKMAPPPGVESVMQTKAKPIPRMELQQ
ncbi:MAG: hypothetical protein GC134_04875 [Proteobacteria bacterium]|nr:hypothetical protein [Pseudomonadota bacterium]